MKRRGAVLLLAAVTAVGLCLAPAGAAGADDGEVLVVDDDADGGCHGRDADYSTIQAALADAEPGDTIRVCPGLYPETVKVTTERLTIKGANAGRNAAKGDRDPESIVTGDPATTDDGVVQLLNDDITWDGFLIRGVVAQVSDPGMYTSPQHSGYEIRNTIFEDNGLGLHLGSSGADQTTVCRNRFVANNEFKQPGAGTGIFSDQGAKDVVIAENRFERHNEAGILFADSAADIRQRDIRVGWNKSVEDRTFAAFFATAGLVLKRNVARARLTDPDPRLRTPVSAIFIGARNQDVVLYRNRVQAASGNGIDVTDSGHPTLSPAAPTNVDLLKNWVEHAQLLGISVSASGLRQYELRGNRAIANVQVGIHLGPATDDVVLKGNKALENALDCQDESVGESATDGTAGTENSWEDNAGISQLPDGICGPPGPDRPRDGDGTGHKKRKKRDPCRCTLPWRL